MTISIRHWWSLLILTLFLLLPIANIEAANTVSVNNGEPMKTLVWAVGGAPSCSPATTYPPAPFAADGISASWISATRTGNGTTDFGGVNVDVSAHLALLGVSFNSYDFSCSVPVTGPSDIATLVVCDNITVAADGAGGCAPKFPDLVPVGGLVVNGALNQWGTVSFTGQVRNAGNAPTPNGFENNFSYRWGGVGAWIDILPHATKNILPAGSTAALDTSPNFTLTNSGILEVQYCVDSGNLVNDGPNEGNECIVTSVIVVPNAPVPIINSFNGTPTVVSGGQPTLNWNVSNATDCSINQGIGPVIPPRALVDSTIAPAIVVATTYTLQCSNGTGPSLPRDWTVNISSGNIAVGNCTIAPEASNCSTGVTWLVNNPVGPIEVTQAGSLISNAISMGAPGTPVTISPTNNTLILEDLGTGFTDADSGSATCDPTSVWVDTIVPPRCATRPLISILAEPNVIRSGNSANVEVTINSLYDLNCTIQDGGAVKSISHILTGGRVQTYSVATRTLTSAQAVKIDCVSIPSPLINGSGETRVNVVPTYQET